MGRSQESFNKKEVRKKKAKKRLDKEKKKLERKDEQSTHSSLDDMIAYVDEYGNITDTPPDPEEKEEIKAEDIVLSNEKANNADDQTEKEGIVTFFNDNKGFGFIKEANTKQDYFVHVSNLSEPILEGNRVTFEIGQGDKGPIAIKVKVQR